MKDLLVRIRVVIQAVFNWMTTVVERHLYVIPAVIGVLGLICAAYLMSVFLATVSRLDSTIQAIPALIHNELKSTRDVLHDEGSSARDVISGEHEITRGEIGDRFRVLNQDRLGDDQQRRRMLKALADLQTELQNQTRQKEAAAAALAASAKHPKR
jgi:hypothetical protein